MTINAANLVFRLSGGAGNSNVHASLGGVMSSTVMQSQQVPVLSMAGAQLVYSGGLTVGAANTIRHTYTGSVHYLELKDAQDSSYGPAVAIPSTGLYYLSGADRGSIAINCTPGSMSTTTVTETFNVTNVKNNLFDDVLKPDALAGATDYRCIYLYNTHATESFLQVGVYGFGASGNPAIAGDLFYVGEDAAGLGNGSTTGVATVIANEAAVPSGVTFSSPLIGSPLLLGAIGPQQCKAVWLKRVVPPALYALTPDDYVSFGLKLIF